MAVVVVAGAKSDTDPEALLPSHVTEPTTLGALARAQEPPSQGEETPEEVEKKRQMAEKKRQIAEKEAAGLYNTMCPFGLYWFPGFFLGSLGIVVIVLGAMAMNDASESEYVSATCSLIEATWKKSCQKSNDAGTCSYSCAYMLESDVTGSQRFGSSDMTSSDIIGTGSATGCSDFSCVVNVKAKITDIKKCGGGPCASCSVTGECAGCIGAAAMKTEACRSNCSGLQTACHAKKKDDKVHKLTLKSQDEEKAGSVIVLVLGSIFACCGLCCGIPIGLSCGSKNR